MGEEQRPSLTVSVLLSEPLEFEASEIVEAVNEDFPACELSDAITASDTMKTNEIIGGFFPSKEKTNASILINGLGVVDDTFRNGGHLRELGMASLPDAEAAVHAVQTHESYFNLSVSLEDDDLASRFRAVRQLTCVAAVFAKLPITLGIHVQWAGKVVTPERWVQAAEMASQGTWPIAQWIGATAGWSTPPDANDQGGLAVGYTVGLANFIDAEIHIAPAPKLPTEIVGLLNVTSYMPLQGGSILRDGDTIGVEDHALKYRIRHRPESAGFDHTVIVLLHPDGPTDELAEFGENPLAPPPEGLDNTKRVKPNFMQRLLGRN